MTWRRSGDFIVKFKHILQLFFCSVSIIDFGQVNADWVKFQKLRERSIKGNPDKKKSEPRHERRSSAFVVNFEHVISHPR